MEGEGDREKGRRKGGETEENTSTPELSSD